MKQKRMTAAEHLKFAKALHRLRGEMVNMHRFVCSRFGRNHPATKEIAKAVKYLDGPEFRSHMEDELYRDGEEIPMRNAMGAYGLTIYYPGAVTTLSGNGEEWFAGLPECNSVEEVKP